MITYCIITLAIVQRCRKKKGSLDEHNFEGIFSRMGVRGIKTDTVASRGKNPTKKKVDLNIDRVLDNASY